jgi:transposase
VIFQRTSVGLDVHARSVVAAAIDERTGEVVRRRFGYDPAGVVAWARSLPQPVAVTYEAGPTGFALARLFEVAGITCLVAAPSKLQRPTGDRVKTDARDALHLARLLRLDEIVAVRVPSLEQETARDLVRAREDNRGELMAARHRLSKLLLRHGIIYDGKAWTGAHDAWLRRYRFEHQGLQAAFDADYEAVQQVGARKDRLDKLLEQMAATSEYADTVRRLGCLRGISTLTAFGLAVEIGDWDRFTGSTIGAFLGLVPAEFSSGQSRVQGSITKTGNTHARRLLVEAAWHHRKPYRPGAVMQARWAKARASPSPVAMPATIGCIESGNSSPSARSVP